MATVHRFGGFRVVICSNDHRPPHVHVVAADVEIVYALNCPSGPVEMRHAYGRRLSGADAAKIVAELMINLHKLCAAWEAIHDAD